MSYNILTEDEIDFICTELEMLNEKLYNKIKFLIADAERSFTDEAEKRGFNFVHNPANSGYLTAGIIQNLLDCLSQNDKLIATLILTNEARRLGVVISTHIQN